jgi:beta-xylosidase
MRRAMLGITALMMLSWSLVAAAPSTAGGAHNPVFPGADPHLAVACGRYWIYPTNAVDPGNGFVASRFYAYSSADLQRWTRSAPLIDIASIKWIGDDGAREHFLWAPGLAVKGGHYFLYYSVGPQNPTPSRLGVAVGTSPAGPFVDSGAPLLTGGNGFEAIDPMTFIDPASGKAYLYAGGSAGATLRVFELTPDMVHIAREIPVQTPPGFTEGAFMHVRNGVYYLSYSHGRWNDATYSVRYATAPSPIGPWRYRGVILTSDATHRGPGHHSFAQDPVNGAWIIAYHRWEQRSRTGPFTGVRQTAVQTISYARDGTIRPIRISDTTPPPMPLPAARPGEHCPG